MGTLYVVATPIGNLDDLTIRAIKTLLTVPVIACEDTRRSGNLISLLERDTPLRTNLKGVTRRFISVRDWNEAEVIDRVIQELEKSDVALVSDAGTPLISDPGYKLVRAVRELGTRIIPIPGPSALTTALSVAGLPTNKFMFWGFLPKKWDLTAGMTHVIFENAVRLPKLLGLLREKYPEAEIMVAQELTKVHESVGIWTEGMKLKGEVTILVYIPERRLRPDMVMGTGIPVR